jgi:hypothetical protein
VVRVAIAARAIHGSWVGDLGVLGGIVVPEVIPQEHRVPARRLRHLRQFGQDRWPGAFTTVCCVASLARRMDAVRARRNNMPIIAIASISASIRLSPERYEAFVAEENSLLKKPPMVCIAVTGHSECGSPDAPVDSQMSNQP